MALAIDGLVSGLDTTSLINSLMQVEAAPQTILKNKVTSSQAYVTALQGLNTKVAALATTAGELAKPAAFDLFTATSSSEKVTAATTAGASAGRLEFVVDRLAQAQSSVTAAMTAWPDSPPSLTLVAADGTRTAITAAGDSLDDVVAAINSAEVGVSASKIAIGGGAFRLQLTSDETGAAGAFSLYRGTGADIDAGTATDVFAASGAARIREAADAAVTLFGGTAAEQTVTSSTNTFAGLLTGVSVTVAAASDDPVTVAITRDDKGISTKAGELVTALTGIFSSIAAQSSVTTGTDPTGTSTTKSGVFAGDSTVRDVNQKVLSAATLPLNGRSPSEFGISITKSGSVEFDEKKLAAALAADPVATQTALQELASRISTAATAASDKYDGQLTSKITGQQSLVRELGNQVDDWDRRLNTRRTTLERTYSALEVQLSALNSQSSWLTSQLSSLSTGSSS